MFSAFSAAPKQKTSAELHDLVRDKLLREAGVDFESRPILVIYACYLPNPAEANYDVLLDMFFQRLNEFVLNDYVVVLFAAGNKYQPGWSWLYKAYSHLGREYRKNLKNLYVVHPSLWPRMIIQGMGAVVSPKFARKVQWVYTLADLGVSIPLNQLHIPDVIREVDAKNSGTKVPPGPPIDDSSTEQLPTVFGAPLHDIMGVHGEKGVPRVISDCIEYIRKEGLAIEGIFRRSPASKQLRHAKRAYNRGDDNFALEQCGDVHLACSLLKSFFRDLPEPVFPAATYDVIRGIHSCTDENEQVHLFSDQNLMTSSNLTIVWAPNLLRSDNPVADFNMGAMGPQGGGAGVMIKLCVERYPDVFPEGGT